MDDILRFKVRHLDEKLRRKLLQGSRAIEAKLLGSYTDEDIFTLEYANYMWQNKYNEDHFKRYEFDEAEMKRLYDYAYDENPVVPYEDFKRYMTKVMKEENEKSGFLSIEEYAVFRVPFSELEYYREFPKGTAHTYEVYTQAVQDIDKKYSSPEQLLYIHKRTGYPLDKITKYFRHK